MHVSYIYVIYGQSICCILINKVCSVYLIQKLQKLKLVSQLLLMHQRECLQSSEAVSISYIFFFFNQAAGVFCNCSAMPPPGEKFQK